MNDFIRYANQGAVRSQPLSPELVGALGFLPELGVTMEVFSGGQPEAGGGPRVGSTRHDHGNAADVFFYKDGRKLDWANPQDRPIFEEIVRRGKASGITGFGAGEGYMRPGSMHLGFGKPAVWGDGGSGANAPEWLRSAYSGAPSGSPVQTAFDPVAFGAIALDDAPTATPGAQALDALASAKPVAFDPVKAGAVPFDPIAAGAQPVEDVQPQHPEFDPANAPPQGGGASDRIGAFLSGFSDLPIVGPAVHAAQRGIAAGIVAPFSEKTFGEVYDEMGDRQRQVMQENPGTATAGQVTGAVASMIPLGATGIGGRALGLTGGLGTRSLMSGLSGAGIGAADTAARGGSLSDAATVGALGGAIGGAIPGVGAGLNALGRSVADAVGPRLNSIVRPAQEAGRRVARAIGIDEANSAVPVLNQTDEASAAINQQNLLNVDRGGETTRALARSAANTDPEARAILDRTASDRFAAQGERAQSFVGRIMNGATDDLALQDSIKAAARKANAPAYRKAYQEGSDLILTPEMERLTSSPAVVQAMKSVASGKGRDRAVAEGFGAFNPGVSIADDGRIAFKGAKPGGSPAFPDLQFWDYTKRELDDMAKAAARAGKTEEASTLQGLARTLRTELDAQVPSYRAAREGAASFFGAEDALDAGRKFVTQNRTLPETRRALAKMSKEERVAFAVGFASELKDAIAQAGDRTNVINKIFGSPQAREKIRMALGPARYREFEQFVRVENTMDMLRGALGNSTTARQLQELGLAGGAGVGIGALTGDWKTALTTGLLVRGARAAGAKIDQNVMKNVAEMLVSDDPKLIERAVKMAAKNPNIAKAIDGVSRVIGAAARSGPSIAGRERKPLEITVTPSPAGG